MTTPFTSAAEIERVFSSDGLNSHLEDTDHETLTEIINRATQRVLLYLRTNHDLEDLTDNIWVREQATYIACFLLSIRRGEHSLYSDMYAQVLEELSLVRSGLLDPGIIARPQPVVQTPGTDNRTLETLKTNPRRSTRMTGKQNNYYPFMAWHG